MARKSRKFGNNDIGLNITSMMDAFTIVLVFLLKSFAADGNLITQADNLRLPLSASQKTIKEIALTVIVDRNAVLVDDEIVIKTADIGKQEDLIVPKMLDILKEKREKEIKVALMLGEEDEEKKGKVIVQLDRNIPYDIMYKVMATCGNAGYSNIAFAVVQKIGE